ncbi:MAG: ammonia-forming cytochrome c nitrite reductase subunit c552 [Oligoflexia bacterium]|nr:ammonia-forming cytochrome c nitrite reductase subunit c552 [Oligoflexia bacterium]
MAITDLTHRLRSPKIALLALLITAVATFLIAYLLVSIFRHKTEAANPYLRFVEVKQSTTDPAPWGLNWPREYDRYKSTVQASRTNFGGGDANPAQKSEVFPFLTRMFAGYAFGIDYRDRRGHSYMLHDQEITRRVTERPQSGACLHCHASVIPTYVRLGGEDPEKTPYNDKTIHDGLVKLSAMKYWDAHAEVIKTGSSTPIEGKPDQFKHFEGAHPVSCTDCHNAKTMRLEVRRPGFVAGIRALKASQGIKDFDVNRDATRSEMRTFVCAQCHVEYYCGPKTTLFFPWNNGVKIEEIEKTYDNYKFADGKRFNDWVHAETGAELLKAQHPEFEMWNQGVHAKSGVSCTDCHMPYVREGAMKVSDHYVRSPLLMVAQSCQQCHGWSESELTNRVASIQNTTFAQMLRAGQSLTDFLDTFKTLRAPFNEKNRALAAQQAREKLSKDAAFAKLSGAEQEKKLTEATQGALNALWAEHVAKTPELKAIGELQRKAQWRLDYVAAENSMGFHAPQEATRILGESIDYFRQAQLETVRLLGPGAKYPVTLEPARKK